MKKKILGILLCLMLFLGVVGCGKSKEEKKQEEEIKKEEEGLTKEQKISNVIKDFYSAIAKQDYEKLAEIYDLELTNELSTEKISKEDIINIEKDEDLEDNPVTIKINKAYAIESEQDLTKYLPKDSSVSWDSLQEMKNNHDNYYIYYVTGKMTQNDDEQDIMDIIYIKENDGNYSIVLSTLLFLIK